jgi:hypothetical protein
MENFHIRLEKLKGAFIRRLSYHPRQIDMNKSFQSRSLHLHIE